ncbi:unnamed protein product, partial [Vitis vinifera]
MGKLCLATCLSHIHMLDLWMMRIKMEAMLKMVETWQCMMFLALYQGSKSRSRPVRLGRVISASTMAGTGPIPELE